MNLHTVSPNSGIAMYTDSTEWGDSDPLCSADWALDIIQAELLHLYGVDPWVGMDHLFHHPSSTWASVGQLQWPRHDYPKMGLSPGHGHLC